MSTRFELRHELKLKGLWSEEDDKKIEELKEKVTQIEEDLGGLAKGSKARKITQALLTSLKNNLADKLVNKRQLFGAAAEDYAEESKSAALVFCSTYTDRDEKYWPSYKDFLNESDNILIGNIVEEINKASTLETKQIREIARAPGWRFRWNAGKTHGGLFERRLLDLDANQQSLVYWSQVYDSVYESYERPDDEIINDDEKLDKWFDSQDKKKKTDKLLEGKDAGNIKLSNRISQHGEIFVVANKAINPDAPNIQEIEGLNQEYVKHFKRKEHKISAELRPELCRYRSRGEYRIGEVMRGRLSKHTEKKNTNWHVSSRKKLKASMENKMKRIFVGILDLLDKGKLEGNIGEETHATLRSRILNVGNDQIRNMRKELDERYNIEFIPYHMEFKVVPVEGLGPIVGGEGHE